MQTTFEALKNLYQNGMITKAKVQRAVNKGLIIQEELTQIVEENTDTE